MPEIYKIGRTKIPSTRLANGNTLLDLRRFMREDFTPYIDREVCPPEIASILGDRPNIINMAPHPIRYGESNVVHAPFIKIRKAAEDFKFVEATTRRPVKIKYPYGVIKREELLEKVPEIEQVLDRFFVQEPGSSDLIFKPDIVETIEISILERSDIEIEIKRRFLDVVEKTYYDTYRRGLKVYWTNPVDPYISLELASPSSYPILDSSRKKYNYVDVIDTNISYKLKAMEVRCSKDVSYEEDSIKFLSSQTEPNDNVIWQGYLNNFWHVFRFDPKNNSGQIDDSLDPIKGLYVNSWASLTIEFQNAINMRRLIAAAIIQAICFNFPFVEYKFEALE